MGGVIKMVLPVAGALVVGVVLGVLFSAATIRHLRRRVRGLRAGTAPVGIFQSVTKFLFITAQVFAIVWVSVSYGIAVYSTVVLFQPFPVVELSQQAIVTIIGAMALKVVENIFEHNEGAVFGRSKAADSAPEDQEPPAAG